MTTSAVTLRRVRSLAERPIVPLGLLAVVAAGMGGAVTRRPAVLGLFAVLAVAVWGIVSPRTLILAAIPALMFPPLSVGSAISPGYIVVGALAASWLVGLPLRRWSLHWRIHGVLALLALWLVITWNLHHAHGHAASVSSDFRTLLLGLLLCAVAASVRPDARQVLRVTALTGTVVAVAATLSGQSWQDAAGNRVTLMGLNPNYLGLLLATSFCACAALALNDTLRARPLFLACAIAHAGALVSTRSRGAFVAAGLGVLVVALAGRSRKAKLTIILAVGLVVLLSPNAPSAISATALNGRSAQELNADTGIRQDVLGVAWKTSLSHPLTGVGYGSFPDVATRDPRLGIFINTHNDYLRLSAESGLAALALLLALVSVIVLLDVRHPVERSVLAVLVAYFGGLMFANTLSNLKVTGAAWVLLGTAWALVLGRERNHAGFAAIGLARLRSARHSLARGSTSKNGVPVARTNQTT